MPDWLGAYPGWDGKKLSYIETRDYARSLNLKSSSEWRNHRNDIPYNISVQPKYYFKNKGWISWEDFLGIE